MLVLGLNAFHADLSAALLRDGKLIAAAEEERFRRLKHWAGFPTRAIAYCLSEAGVQLSDVDHVAFNQDSRAHLLKKMRYVLTKRPDINLIINRLRNRRARAGILDLLEAAFPGQSFKGKLHPIEHHLAHLSSAFHVSPFREAAVVSIDGFGDFSSALWGTGYDGQISSYERVYFPHSLGIFYQALTQYLGFPHYGDEYKVMGLAPYGRPTYHEVMREIVKLLPNGGFELDLRYFRHHREDIAYQWTEGSPEFGDLYSPALEGLLGRRRKPDDPLEDRHHNIARSAQAMYEEAFFHLLNTLQKRTGIDRSCPGRRLRDEFRSQWQGKTIYPIPPGLRAGCSGRCRRCYRSGVCGLAQTWGSARFCHGSRLLGPCVH